MPAERENSERDIGAASGETASRSNAGARASEERGRKRLPCILFALLSLSRPRHPPLEYHARYCRVRPVHPPAQGSRGEEYANAV